MIARILAILRKDLIHGPKSFFFVQAVATPIFTTLFISMLFGSSLSGKPALGLLIEGESDLPAIIREIDYIRFSQFDSFDRAKSLVASGKLDMLVSIPTGFDDAIRGGGPAHLRSYLWGQSLLKDRSALFAALFDGFAELAGREVSVDVKTVTIGGTDVKPLAQRFLPLLVLLAVIMSGLIIPASAMVDEKQRQTLTAIRVSPSSFREVVAAKTVFGFLMSLLMGVLILVLNNSLGASPGLLLLTLALAAAFASTFGGLVGILAGDINSLMTVMKSLMLLVYAPGILTLFPKIPGWIPKLFPTYYIFHPVLEVTQNRAGLSDVALELLVLVGFTAVMGCIINATAKKKELHAV
jgi:ABC-2 type transport system permease protein